MIKPSRNVLELLLARGSLVLSGYRLLKLPSVIEAIMPGFNPQMLAFRGKIDMGKI
jgi:hypothetical protein